MSRIVDYRVIELDEQGDNYTMVGRFLSPGNVAVSIGYDFLYNDQEQNIRHLYLGNPESCVLVASIPMDAPFIAVSKNFLKPVTQEDQMEYQLSASLEYEEYQNNFMKTVQAKREKEAKKEDKGYE